MRATTTARDRADLADGETAGSSGISQDYHSAPAVQMRNYLSQEREEPEELPLHHVDLSAVLVELHFIHKLIDEENSASVI
jgi:hypothetical protein